MYIEKKPNFVTVYDVNAKAERKQPCLDLLVLLHLERKRVIYLLRYKKGFRLLLGRKRGEMALTTQAVVFTQSSLWFPNILTPILVHTHFSNPDTIMENLLILLSLVQLICPVPAAKSPDNGQSFPSDLNGLVT